MKGTITVFTEKPVDAIDYIEFSLVNSLTATTDHEISYRDDGYVGKKQYPCLVMEGCSLDLGDIPFGNQIGRINGIKEIQTYDEGAGELINKAKIVAIMFEQDGQQTSLGRNFLKYVA